MKRLMNLICASMLTVIAVSCGSREAKIAEVAKMINAECPISMGLMGEMTSAEVQDGDNIIISCHVDESLMNLEALRNNTDAMKSNLIMAFSNPTDFNTKMLVGILKNTDARLTYRYKGKTTGTTASVTITWQDIAENENSGGTSASGDPVEFLKSQIELTNVQCPMELGNGLVMKNMTLEGDYVIYYYEVDESMILIELLEQNKEASKETAIETLNFDAATRIFVQACKNAGKGIAYKYVGTTSGDTCLIEIGVDEL